MKLIVGLGNPGEKYKNTRHNVGFMVVDELARKMLPLEKTRWKIDSKANALILQVTPELVLAKPQTFVNASGFAVAKLTRRYTLDASHLFVIHDDVDLPLGKIKIRLGGAAAGHHGVESIIKELGTDKFVRFRLGIGHPCPPSLRSGAGRRAGRGADALVERYVLREFDINERTELKYMIKQTIKAIKVALKDGIEKAMSQFNR